MRGWFPVFLGNTQSAVDKQENFLKKLIFFKMLDMEDEKLNNAIAEEKNINFEFFKVAATVKMYNKIVRDELESNYRETNFDPRKMLQYLNKD